MTRGLSRSFALLSFALVATWLWVPRPVNAQRSGLFHGSLDDPAIAYMSGPQHNVLDSLNRGLEAGTAHLTFDGRSGYLRSLVGALGLSPESQMLVFSQGSLQGRRIGPTNPRAIFFGADVELGWVRDAPLVELAAQDATQGVVFYTLAQKETETPRLKQEAFCLGCHMAGDTSGVPGLLMFSSTPDGDGSLGITRSAFTDDTVPVSKRFGGWFVTGAAPPPAHQGNLVPGFEGHAILPLQSTAKLHDPDGYLATTSDIASLMVFAHQVHMVNLLVHAGFESRAFDPAMHADLQGSEALVEPVLRALADDVVDGLLFIDEARLDHKVVGSSGFAERFAAEGPRDRMGRSLRQLDLTHRLMRFPCSYLIYSSVFDSLPPTMKNMIYERMWQVLSGAEKGARYRAALTFTDRQAIAAILRDTKKDLPSYFKLVP